MTETRRNPVVSVLVTAYNREAFVRRAIESVLASTLGDFELIVVDDASQDGTFDVIRDVAATDSRVRIFRNDTNLGDYPNRNQAAALAVGTYIKYVDSDDVIYPHGLEVMVRCMSSYPSAGFGLSEVPDRGGPCPRLLTPPEAYKEHYLASELFGRAPGSAIIRRSAFEAVGGFSGKRQVGDHELWLRMARTFDMVKMPRDLVWDSDHPHQEKRHDSLVDLALMHEQIDLEALSSTDCPLDGGQVRAALSRLSSSQARNFLSIARIRGFGEADDYRKRTGLRVRAIIGFAAAKVLGFNRRTL